MAFAKSYQCCQHFYDDDGVCAMTHAPLRVLLIPIFIIAHIVCLVKHFVKFLEIIINNNSRLSSRFMLIVVCFL